MNRHGFTIIELMVCMIIIGLLAGAIMLSLRGAGRRVKWKDTVDYIVRIDEQVRLFSQLHGLGGQLRLNLLSDVSEIVYIPSTHVDIPSDVNLSRFETKKRVWEIPSPFRIEQIRIAGGEVSKTQVALPVGPNGMTLSYAIKLKGEVKQTQDISNDEVDRSSYNRWLIFVGSTGQVHQTDHQEEVDAILQATK
ncbi:hypothetical protein KS4_26460 [Poriferisphaera corsica]|uniref:Prepilin-type N-terminal cleavage/methylation domain-containing protein n=1 Tax=Poriferisphaera corsica TaxID=2528020 RepID=A0A517YWH0_9BACT|nr:type II secretion system protein [Poriferisphaera corsica]QDU34576.1 hypothetical protein KS4_26460 [Poriferisphaera corsica]